MWIPRFRVKAHDEATLRSSIAEAKSLDGGQKLAWFTHIANMKCIHMYTLYTPEDEHGTSFPGGLEDHFPFLNG